jgi:hypothetical protein
MALLLIGAYFALPTGAWILTVVISVVAVAVKIISGTRTP